MFDNAKKDDVKRVEDLAGNIDARVAGVSRQVGDMDVHMLDLGDRVGQLCDALLPKPVKPQAEVPMHPMRRDEAQKFYGGGLYLVAKRLSPALCC